MYSDEPEREWKQGWAHAILTMDPASVSDSGLCLRDTRKLFTPTFEVRTPKWFWHGNVWNTAMHDELGYILSRLVPRGGRVVFAANSTAFQGVAFKLGRAVGCIEGLLHDLNVLHGQVVPVQDVSWRAAMYTDREKRALSTLPRAKRRDALKAQAVESVRRMHRIDTTHDVAEAILLGNYIVSRRPELYNPNATRKTSEHA